MPSKLDLRMDAGIAALTGEGGPLRVGGFERFGRTLPMFVGIPATLPQYFAHYCTEHADGVFLVAGEERLTFGEVYVQAGLVARALAGGFGIARGERIGIAMRNSPSWIVLYMGIVMAGGIATLVNGWWQTEEMKAAIREVEPRMIFADPPRASRLAAIADVDTVVIDDALPLAEALAGVVAKGGAEAALPEIGADDLATILFTSGSTGQSKGALSDHRAILQGVYSFLGQALTILGISTEDGKPPVTHHSTLLTVPLFHVTAEIPVFLQSFAMGRKLVIMPKWDAEEAMRLIEQERVTYFVGVPLMSFEMLTHPNRARYDLSTVSDFAAGGAPRPVDHVRRIEAEMGGGAPLIGYGLTETNAVGAGNWRSNYLAKPNSTGRATAPLVEIAILGDAGAPLAQGEHGEIAIRSICNFREYWGRPDATAKAITPDGFFRTGDIGYLDEDGYVFIVDRSKDIIIRGGENISCQEVEAALYEHPQVAECAVFALPDERFGEVPGAVVVPRGGVALDQVTLQAFLHVHVAAFKVPARIWISHEPLPRLGTEKIDKVSIRATYRALAAATAAG